MLGAILIAAWSLAACGTTSSQTAPSNTRAADRALDAAMQSLVRTQGGPPGIVSVVQRNGLITLHTAGFADVSTSTSPAIGDHMRIASVSKAFSGASALALVANGALSLSDTIGKRLPQLPAAWRQVTLAEALHHTSGLPDYSSSSAFRDAVTTAPFNPPPPAGLLSYVKDEQLEFTPGSQYRYSNSDNLVVGLMIEAVTGRPYEQVLHDEVLGPLGLIDTTLPREAVIPSPVLHGYAVAPPSPPADATVQFSPGYAWASGGIVSTPADVNRFIRGYVRGATTDRTVNEQQFQFVGGNSDPPGPGANHAGLGIFRYTTRCGTVYGHTGGFPNSYTQFIAASRDGSRSTTVSINSSITVQSGSRLYSALRNVFVLAVCAALAGT